MKIAEVIDRAKSYVCVHRMDDSGVMLDFYNSKYEYLKVLLIAAYEEKHYDWLPESIRKDVEKYVTVFGECACSHNTLTFLLWLMRTNRVQVLMEKLKFTRFDGGICFANEDAALTWLSGNEEMANRLRAIYCADEERSNASEFIAMILGFNKAGDKSVLQMSLSALASLRMLMTNQKIKEYSELKNLVSLISVGQFKGYDKDELAKSIYATVISFLDIQCSGNVISDCMRW